MLHNAELLILNSSPNIVSVIKSRRLRRTSHVARMEKGKSYFKNLIGVPRGGPRGGWTMLEYILKKLVSIREIGLEAQDRYHWKNLLLRH